MPERPAAGAPAVLEVDGLTVDFVTGGQRSRVIDGVSLRVERGRTLAIVGESGSGKSVTSLAVMGLLPTPPAAVGGQGIRFCGRDGRAHDLLKLDRRRLRSLRGDDLAMVFQEPMTSLNPSHSIGRQIGEVLAIHRGAGRAEGRAAAVRMLERVGIPEAGRRVDSYPHELSGGMRQRVMIAMALVCGPSLLIADEPTTALDVTIQAQILDEMRKLQAELGMAMLFITHDLGVVAEIARDVVVMYAGQVVEQGPVAAVLRRPRHPYTRGLLASVPRTDRQRATRLEAIPGRVPDPRQMPAGCRFHPRCAFAVPGRCDREQPVLESLEPGHAARCLRAAELDFAA